MGARISGVQDDPLAVLASAIQVLTGRQDVSAEIEQFRRYLDLLLAWNRAHRLTGLRSPAAIVTDLLRDALLFLARLPEGPLAMADIGTGPGIPGVPLRIVRPEISLTLIESRRKPVSFLECLKRELGLTNTVVLEGRAEQLLSEREELIEGFDVVVSRAVGVEFLPVAMRYVKPGGRFLAGGPPPGQARTKLRGPASEALRLETIPFPSLGLTRRFLVSYKPA